MGINKIRKMSKNYGGIIGKIESIIDSDLQPSDFGCTYQADHLCLCYNNVIWLSMYDLAIRI